MISLLKYILFPFIIVIKPTMLAKALKMTFSKAPFQLIYHNYKFIVPKYSFTRNNLVNNMFHITPLILGLRRLVLS